MQKKLFVISVLIALFSSRAWATSLPPLPDSPPSIIVEQPSTNTKTVSSWQKIKNFFGMNDSDQQQELNKENILDQGASKVIVSKNENHQNDSTSIDREQLEDEDIQTGDKKLDIDDFFKNVDKKFQDEDEFSTNISALVDVNNQVAPSIPSDLAMNNSENLVKTKADKAPPMISFPQPENDKAAEFEIVMEPLKPKETDKNEGIITPTTSNQILAPSTILSEPNVKTSENIIKPTLEKVPEISFIKGSKISENEKAGKPAKSQEIPKEAQTKVPSVLEPSSNISSNVVLENSSSKNDPKPNSINKFREEIEHRNAKRLANLPLIPEQDLTQDTVAKNSKILDSKQLKFISDEAKVLIIPNDDVVLGNLTDEAAIQQTDFSTYVKIFWQEYETKIRSDQRQVIDNFIDNYEDNYNKKKLPVSLEDNLDILNEAFTAIGRHDINKFTVMLNNYPILMMKDNKQNSLLHQAAYVGNYSATKLLIMKGIDINAINITGESPRSIAEKYSNSYISYLLKKSGALPIQ